MITIEKKRKLHHLIPEGETGLNDIMHFSEAGQLVDVEVELDISHPFKGDLYVELISPAGEKVILHDRQGGSEDNLLKTYRKDIFGTFIGAQTKGDWQLNVIDLALKDQGWLESWKLSLTINDQKEEG